MSIKEYIGGQCANPYYLCHLRGLADNLFVIVDDFLTAVTIILDFCEICGIILYVKCV